MGGGACTQPETPAPTTYTITFDSGVESISVEEGAVAKEPAKPTKDGYTFVEWLNGETAYDWTAPVTGHLTLTAKWAVEKYTIDYKLPEDSTNDESNLVEYTIESETISELKDPKLPEGLTFLGWYTDENCTVAFESIEKGSTGNVVIYAKYTDKQTFTVTYYIGDKANTKLEEKDAVFTLTGYDLFTDKECTKAYKDPITSDTTLYAKVKKMTVKFDSNGGSAVEDAKVDYNTAVAKPTDPTKDDFDFVGWYEGKKEFDFATKITKDITLTAKWEEKKATEPEITYDVVTVDGNVTTILRPTMEKAWGATVKGNVISFSGNSAAKWTYENIKEYSIVELFYETTKTENAKLSIKSSDGNESHSDLGYPDLSASGSLKYNIADFVTKNSNFSHIVMANNANNNDWSDNGANIKWDDDWSVTITKIVLTKVEKLEDKVIFDPASFTAPEGMEIVEKDGVKYLKVTPNGYKTSIDLAAPVDISGYTHYTYDFYNDEAADDWQVVIALKNYSEGVTGDDQAVGNGTDVSSTEVKTVTSAIIKDSTVTALQPFAQSKTDWNALTDKVVYIGKITAITK